MVLAMSALVNTLLEIGLAILHRIPTRKRKPPARKLTQEEIRKGLDDSKRYADAKIAAREAKPDG